MAQSKSPILIVVDVQRGFVNSNSEVVLPNVVRLVECAVKSQVQIFFTQFINSSGSNWERLLDWTRLRAEPEIGFHETIEPLTTLGTIVPKVNQYSSVLGAIKDRLARDDVKEVILCGIATESCVLASAVELFDSYTAPVQPIVVSDACASHAGKAPHDAGLLVLQRFIGRRQVVDTQHVIDNILSENSIN